MYNLHVITPLLPLISSRYCPLGQPLPTPVQLLPNPGSYR